MREIKGVKYYNDTTATTPEATIAALRAFNSKKIILIAGGADKKLDYRELAKEIPRYVKILILFKGEASEKILNELRIMNYELSKNHNSLFIIHNSGMRMAMNISDMKTALQIARRNAIQGDIILLSPAAASFSIFKNEFDRGEQFCAIVDFVALER